VLKEWLANKDWDLRESEGDIWNEGMNGKQDGEEVEFHRGAGLLGECGPETTVRRAVDRPRP
jgi:hypothetical protein